MYGDSPEQLVIDVKWRVKDVTTCVGWRTWCVVSKTWCDVSRMWRDVSCPGCEVCRVKYVTWCVVSCQVRDVTCRVKDVTCCVKDMSWRDVTCQGRVVSCQWCDVSWRASCQVRYVSCHTQDVTVVSRTWHDLSCLRRDASYLVFWLLGTAAERWQILASFLSFSGRLAAKLASFTVFTWPPYDPEVDNCHDNRSG